MWYYEPDYSILSAPKPPPFRCDDGNRRLALLRAQDEAAECEDAVDFVSRIRFHDIRHTFGSLLLAQGASLHSFKEQIGHASIQTTADVGEHVARGNSDRYT